MMSEYYDEPRYPENDQSITLNPEVRVEWNNQAVIGAVIERVSELIYDDIKPQVSEAVTNSLHDLVNKAMLEMFDSEVQLTDRWGKSLGSPLSIRAMLQRDAETWLMDNVDSSGRAGRDSYGDRHPRIHWLFQEALNGKENSRGTTALRQMAIKAIKNTIGNVESIINAEVRAQVKKALE
jgi:hypothetical protein